MNTATQPPDTRPAAEPYTVPRFRAAIDLKLDGNEGRPPPASLFASLSDPDLLLRRYPDASELEAALAERHGVAAERIIVTAGADDALDRVCRALLGAGSEIVIPTPTFEMLPRYARMTGAALREVPWPRGDYPTSAVLDVITPRTAVICVVSPNNPTGAVASAADLRKLAAAAPAATLLLDAAYGEFADSDLTESALELPRTIITRTLSKAWGLAGLRVGYAIAPSSLARRLRATGLPYPVSAPSLCLALARLASGDADVRRYVQAVRSERPALQRRMSELGLAAEPSQANFVFARTRRAAWLRDGLAGLGIAVRGWPRGELANSIRITCPGDEVAQARLLAGLDAVLAPQAILFDIDALPSRAVLARLAARLPLAIATGATRPATMARLEDQQVADLFAVVVCGEAAADPAPARVDLALAKLAVSAAWLVGSGADDIRAGRDAGVVALGYANSRSEGQGATSADSLLDAGAARILNRVDDLEELLS